MNPAHVRPHIPVHIGGRGPFPFILDTGVPSVIIDGQLVEELGLEPSGTVEVMSPAARRPTTMPTVRLPGFAIGTLEFPPLDATVVDLAAMTGSGADAPRGVLGVPVLAGHLVTFDYEAQRVEIVPGELPPPDGTHVFSYPDDSPIPELPLVLGARHLAVHVDTGSPGNLTLPLELAATLPLAEKPVVVGQAGLVDQVLDIYGATLEGSATVGGVRLDRPALEFLSGVPIGNVGNRFLAGRVLTVDPGNHRVRLVEGAGASGARSMAVGPKRYGIRFHDFAGSPLDVAGVDEGGPAWTAGLRAGDRIVEINSQAVSALDRGDRISALRTSPLRLRVTRAGEELDLSIALD